MGCLVSTADSTLVHSSLDHTRVRITLECRHAVIKWEYEARDTMGTLKSYPTGCDVLDAYWRTLIVNKTAEDFKPEPEVGEKYKAAFRRPLVPNDEVECAYYPRGLFRLLKSRYDRLVQSSFGGGYLQPQGRRYVIRMDAMSTNRRFATTVLGYMGLFPSQARKGDAVAIIYGAPSPFVIRPEGQDYQLIGECYVHGIMDGEAMKGVDPETQWEDITLT